MVGNKKILLQINVTANWGSTGKIAEQINLLAQKNGWITYLAYGRYYNSSKSELIHIGSQLEVYEHYVEYRLIDNDGLASRRATRQLVNNIKDIKPDIIHLHNIHDHWLNYQILFEFLNTLEIPIVWTQHDCWNFTGDCWHFSYLACGQWVTGCMRTCPMRHKNVIHKIINHTEEHYKLKKRLFSDTKNLTIVPVSKWLESVIRDSFLKDKNIVTIYNGIDTDVFRPLKFEDLTLKKFGLDSVRYVMGVASAWTKRKGFVDYCKLASAISEEVKIVLVGLTKKMCQEVARYGIIGIPRTNDIEELVALYNGASIVLNLSYEESFGLTTVEGFACGTPSIVYNTTASPELVTPETGVIVEPGNIEGVSEAISYLLSKEKPVKICRERAVSYFSKEDRFKEYLGLYENLLTSK